MQRKRRLWFGRGGAAWLIMQGTDRRLVPVQDRFPWGNRSCRRRSRWRRHRPHYGGRWAERWRNRSPWACGGPHVTRHVRPGEQADLHAGQALWTRIETADEFRPEDQDFHVGQIQTVRDLVRSVAEVERHAMRSLEDAEINGQPLQTQFISRMPTFVPRSTPRLNRKFANRLTRRSKSRRKLRRYGASGCASAMRLTSR